MKKIVIFSFFLTTVLNAQQSNKSNPKVIETPIHIIQLDNSKLPEKVQQRTIFQCYKNNKVVYVDSVDKGLKNCIQIDQGELTKYQPQPADNNPVKPVTPEHPQTLPTPNVTIRPVGTKSATRQKAYRPPCTGMITYKGKNYILPNDKPCPIPEGILQQLKTVQ